MPQGQAGNALLELAASAQLVSGHRDTAARIDELRRTLRREVTYFAVLAGFSAEPSASDIAAGVTQQRLRQGLDPALPLVIALEAPEGASGGAAPAGGGAAPVDGGRVVVTTGVRLTGAFQGYAFSRDQTAHDRSCVYVCGHDTVANPEHASAVEALGGARARVPVAEAELARAAREGARARGELDDAIRAFERARRDADEVYRELEACRARPQRGAEGCTQEAVAEGRAQERLAAAEQRRAAAEGELSAARTARDAAEEQRSAARAAVFRAEAELARTPATVQVPRQCRHSYAVALHTASAAVSATLSGEDLAGEGVVFDRVPLKFEVWDRDESFPAQADRCAEVAHGDPLKIASEAELRSSLTAQAARGVRDKILLAYDGYRRGILARAEREQAAGAVDDATEGYVRYLVLGRTGAERAKLVALLARVRGLPPAAVERLL